MRLRLRSSIVLIGLLLVPRPAAAQWTPIPDVPASDVFSLWANGDTIAAGADTAVYVSTNAGATWKRSARVAAGATSIAGVWVRNGRLYAGTFGQGVFVSDDLGTTWLGFSQGLVGGFADTQLNTRDLFVRGDSLYMATEGGTWVRNLSGGVAWSHFGSGFEDNEAPDVLGITGNATRLVGAAGFNGQSFVRDRGDLDWANTWINDVGAQPGLAPLSILWTGRGWVMGTNIGIFTSATGQPPWTHTGPHLGLAFFLPLVQHGRDVFAAFGIGLTSVLEVSGDDGATWQELETQTGTGVYRLAVSGNELYAGRIDGLWHRALADVAVPGGGGAAGLSFAIAGAQPIAGDVRFAFVLPAPGPVAIDVFNVAGRRVAEPVRASLPAGHNQLSWNARGLAPGVYLARLTAFGRSAVVRMVRVR